MQGAKTAFRARYSGKTSRQNFLDRCRSIPQTGVMKIAINSDNPIDDPILDEYGYSELATKLAPTIIDSGKKQNFVFGIEGPWGSGKTTLLNFLRVQLEEQADNTSTIVLAPWLLGDISDLPRELFSQMGSSLKAIGLDQKSNAAVAKDAAANIAKELDRYSVVTSTASSTLEFLGNFSAPLGLLGKGLKQLGNIANTAAKDPSVVQLRASIEDSLNATEHRFIVLVDDLDRLEPHQATEVLRLLKSVANFSSLTFVICYDRAVLSEAVERSLSVTDGSAFIQKIVQIPFGMPQQEPFALRVQLRKKLTTLYRELYGEALDGDLETELRGAIDEQGTLLRTPREVVAVYNRVALLYPPISRDVYLPDFVRLQLISVLQPKLYDWIERYLNERSVIEMGDGRVSEYEHTELAKELLELVPDRGYDSAQSLFALSQYLPGIQRRELDEPKKCIFAHTSLNDTRTMARQKRLGSPYHYKFYFALAAPSSVLTDEALGELISLARDDLSGLTGKLLEMSSAERMHGRSWLTHAAQRFEEYVKEPEDVTVAGNIALAMADVIDAATKAGMNYETMLHDFTRTQVRDIADHVLTQLASTPEMRAAFWTRLLGCQSLSWLVEDFLRKHLWDNGIVGNRPRPESERIVTDDELRTAKKVIRKRLSDKGVQSSLEPLPDLGGFMFGWKELCGKNMPTKWADTLWDDDIRLANFLLGLRHQAMSDRVYRPLAKSTVSEFLPLERVEEWMSIIEADEDVGQALKQQVADIRYALSLGKRG